MTGLCVRLGRRVGICLAVWLLAAVAAGAPRINNVSLRGLQAGGITTLVVEGAELLPAPRLLFSAPHATYKIKDGATAGRLEVEFTVDGGCESGIYLLRAASASGISEPVALGVDNLPQLPFTPQLSTLNVALTGSLAGSTVLSTSFTGQQGQQVLAEVECQRIGSKLEPVLRIYNARHTQLAWSRQLPSLAGDARCAATLPADGQYSIEIHDAVFRGGEPGFFRLKLGDFRYADLVFPLGVQQGSAAQFEFARTNLPPDTRASATLAVPYGLPREIVAAPWPADVALLSGSRPAVIVSDHPEIVEAPVSEKPQELPAAPVAVNGRLAQPAEQDRYRLAVTPGQQLRFDVLARRAGSALDAVLSIQDEAGKELATNDDRPTTNDPGLDFKVPEGTSAIVLVLRDLRGAGGADFLYRISVTPAGGANYSLSIPAERVLIPRDGSALVRVNVNRSGYPGPITLDFPKLPSGVVIAGNEIPARATTAFVTLSAPALDPEQSLTRVIGTSASKDVALKRQAELPETVVTKHQPWLGGELAVAVTGASPVQLVWQPLASDTKLPLGAELPMKLHVQRSDGVKGAVRLSLLTTQQTPRKKVKENNQEREVDDVERTLRFAASPTVAADQSDTEATLLVPGDLPRIAYDLAVQAELLADDNKTVIATATSPARRMTTVRPITLELATKLVAARAGIGASGTVIGSIRRAAGFSLPVNITLSGLPKGLNAPNVSLTGDQVAFELPLTFPYGTPAGELQDVKLAATSLRDPKDPK